MQEESQSLVGDTGNALAGVEGRFLQEQTAHLYARSPVVFAATGLNSLFVVLVQWGSVPRAGLLGWFGCQCLLTLSRYELFRRFKKVPRTSREARRWRTRHTAGVLGSGMVWGASAIVLFPPDSLPNQLFLAFVLGGMVAGAAGAFAVYMPGFLAYSLPCLGPIAVRLFVAGGPVGVAMTALVILFGVLMTWVAFQNRTVVTASLRLRIENEDLVARLVSENEVREALHAELATELMERRRAEEELRQHQERLEERVEERAREVIAVNRRIEAEIAERRSAERKIARVATEWTTTFDTMKDHVFIADEDFTLRRVNRPLAALLSAEPKDLIGRRCHEVMHGREEPWPECPHVQASEQGRTITREVNDPHLGVPMLVTCSPIRSGNNDSGGIVHVARDISEQKRSEENREQLIAELQEAMSKVKLRAACCRSVHPARRSATTRATGTRSRSTSGTTPKPNSPTASAPTA